MNFIFKFDFQQLLEPYLKNFWGREGYYLSQYVFKTGYNCLSLPLLGKNPGKSEIFSNVIFNFFKKYFSSFSFILKFLTYESR
jgi:hypothetical protein